MALFRKFFYRKPPDGLLEISERVYVFDCCFTTEVLEEDEYKVYIGGIVGQLRESLTDASFMVFNFREGEHHSLITNILSVYDMTVMDYPRQYEGCPLLTMEMIHHFLRSSESWLSLGQQNVLLMHCERGGWPVLAFMLAALLIYRKQYAGEQKTLDMIYKQAPRELLQLMSPLNPLPSQLRYLQYVSRRNVGSEWPPLDRALTLDCIIIRCIPNMDGEGGCRPIFRIYGQDPFMAADRTSKVLFSTPKKSKLVRQYKQVDCELVKIDIHCHIQGDVVLECISLDNDLEREEMMFRVMFNTAFIRSNILMLNRDDIDILWHAKDQFPKDFRAEVLFSEMDSSASLISIELPNIEEKDGLPIEAFARVQEIFSNVDWLSPKADAALNVLQKITASNLLQEKLLSSGSLDRRQLLDLSLEKLILESETSEENIRSPRLKIQTKSKLSSELSKAASSVISKLEPSELQVALQLPPQSKIITQRIPQPSLSTPVSFRSSMQGSPRPILRYHSAPSALGITALLHDHSDFIGKELIHSGTTSSPSSARLSPTALDSPRDIQRSNLPISPLPLVLDARSSLENSLTTASTTTIPDPLPLHQLSLKPIKYLVSQPTQTTSQVRSQLSPSSLQPTSASYIGESPPSLNDSEASISSSSPLSRSSPSSCTKELISVSTPPPPPPLPHFDSPSALATSPPSSRTNGSIFPSSPQPPSTTKLLSSIKKTTQPAPQFSSSDDHLVSSESPIKNSKSVSPPPPPPPPSDLMPPQFQPDAANAAAPTPTPTPTTAPSHSNTDDLDKDMLCPICMQIIKDAFLTTCGHSFCYMCIVTHLRNKSDCPCCAHFLRSNSIFPNILLDKLLKKTSARQIKKTASPFGYLQQALQKGCDMSIKDLEELLTLLTEKKRKMEQEEAETNMQILLGFLYCLRKQKLEELNEIQADLHYIKEDISSVEKQRLELYRSKERYSGKMKMLADDTVSTKSRSSLIDKHGNGINSGAQRSQGWMSSGNSPNPRADAKIQLSSQGPLRKDAYCSSDLHSVAQSGLTVANKRRVHTQFNELQDCYLQKRRNWRKQLYKQEDRDIKFSGGESYNPSLEDFQSVLTSFMRYSRLRVIAELPHGDLFHSPNIVSSIEFDRDDEFFATAGVSRCIKVFEFSSVVNEPADVHFPVVEMATRSKLSCLSWNKYTKSHIASSDYEGIVTVWDVNTRQSVMEYEEHEKRAWSVDFSRSEPSMLVSGSDDCKVKIWCTRQEASVFNIDMKANVCSVKYNPGSSLYVAVGSADHNIHYYDLRNISQPLHVFNGHKKAVSYVKFLSNNELASASTDSTLRLWDVKENLPICVYRGHTNEKNFVGLTVNSEYIACGSETNEVFIYHKAISKPMAWHRFSSDLEDNDEDAGSYFISAVCWKSDSPTILTANSQGTIKVLVLAP